MIIIIIINYPITTRLLYILKAGAVTLWTTESNDISTVTHTSLFSLPAYCYISFGESLRLISIALHEHISELQGVIWDHTVLPAI